MRFSRFLQLNVIILAFSGMLVCSTPITLAAPASQTLTAPVEFQSSVISVSAGTPNLSFGVIGGPSSGIQDFILHPNTEVVTPQGSGSGSVVTGTSNRGNFIVSGDTGNTGNFLDLVVFESNVGGPVACNGGTTGTVSLKIITFSANFIELRGGSQTIGTGGTVEVSSDAEGFFTCIYDVSVRVEPLNF